MDKEPYIYINNEPRTAQDLEGYLKLMSYKFKIYLGSCSRYIQNKRLKEIKYEGS